MGKIRFSWCTGLISLVLALPLLCGRGSAEEIEPEMALELIKSSLASIQNRSITLKCERKEAPNPIKVAAYTRSYDEEIEKLKGDPKNKKAIDELMVHRASVEEVYGKETISSIDLNIKLADLERFGAMQHFKIEGSSPLYYYIENGNGLLVDEADLEVTQLGGTHATLSIIAPGIPQFWISKFIHNGFSVKTVTSDKENINIVLWHSQSDQTCLLTLERATFRPKFLKVEKGGRVEVELNANYTESSDHFPSSAYLKEYFPGTDQVRSVDSWRLTGDNTVAPAEIKSRYSIPSGYRVRELR